MLTDDPEVKAAIERAKKSVSEASQQSASNVMVSDGTGMAGVPSVWVGLLQIQSYEETFRRMELLQRRTLWAFIASIGSSVALALVSLASTLHL